MNPDWDLNFRDQFDHVFYRQYRENTWLATYCFSKYFSKLKNNETTSFCSLQDTWLKLATHTKVWQSKCGCAPPCTCVCWLQNRTGQCMLRPCGCLLSPELWAHFHLSERVKHWPAQHASTRNLAVSPYQIYIRPQEEQRLWKACVVLCMGH